MHQLIKDYAEGKATKQDVIQAIKGLEYQTRLVTMEPLSLAEDSTPTAPTLLSSVQTAAILGLISEQDADEFNKTAEEAAS